MHSTESVGAVDNGGDSFHIETNDGVVGVNSGGLESKTSSKQRHSNGATVRNKRVYFDVETKMHTLNRIENGEAKSAIIREMRLPPSTLATWIKDRDRIAELYRHSMGNRKRLRRVGERSVAGEKSPTTPPSTTIDVDPSTSAHLGGPFVTPSAGDETTIGGADDNASTADEEVTPAGGDEEGDEADDSNETEAEDGVEKDEETTGLLQQTVQMTQQPSLHTVATSAAAAGGTAIAIPLLRRAPQMVLPRPLIPRTPAAPSQCQQFQQPQQSHQQQQQQQQNQASVTLRPTISTSTHLPPTAAVSLGAFLTAAAAPQTPQHHGLLATQQFLQQQYQHQQQQQQQHKEQPITKAELEELFQRYTAQLSAILTFTISPIHSTLEQLNRRLNQLDSLNYQGPLNARSCDWLEHTKQHPTEPEKVLLAAETNYQMAIPLAWIQECCTDESACNGPERTLVKLMHRAIGRKQLSQLLSMGPTALSEDATFKALRHYIALTLGPVSTQRMCARREDLLALVSADNDTVDHNANLEDACE